MKKQKQQKQHNAKPKAQNAIGNLPRSLKQGNQKNLRGIQMKTRKRKTTAMDPAPEQLQPKPRSGRMSHIRMKPRMNGSWHEG